MSEGLKFDKDKPDWSLLPIGEIEKVVEILTFGAKKYGRNNWQDLENGSERYYAALMRHLSAWLQGEDNDPESGMSHLSHVMCNAMFMSWLSEEKPKVALVNKAYINRYCSDTDLFEIKSN